MALCKELLKVLDNNKEPLAKRLKIADNVFNSVGLPIQHPEVFLFNWICKNTKYDQNVWTLFCTWLTSEHMKDINRSSIGQDDLNTLTEVIMTAVRHPLTDDLREIIVNSAIALIENKPFQQYFKHDLKSYCVFVSTVLDNVDDSKLILKVITNENLFNKFLIGHEKFYKYFIEKTLPVLGKLAEKFEDDAAIFEELSKLLQKCLFNANSFKEFFETIFDAKVSTVKHLIPKLLLKTLQNSEKYLYKLVFSAFCNSRQFALTYKFLVVLVHSLGFDLTDSFALHKTEKFTNKGNHVNKSVEILVEIFNILSKNKNILDSKINEITFNDFIKKLIQSVIHYTKNPDLNAYKLLNSTMIINPLIIESIIAEVLIYTMLSNDENETYEKFMISIFEIFAKLHRIQNLISKMIPNLKFALTGNKKGSEAQFEFYGEVPLTKCDCNYSLPNILPEGVLNYFTQCIIPLASWQVINLFKTLLFHLDEAVNENFPKNCNFTWEFIYIEIISALLCQVLASVRIAEHTVSASVVTKFVASMDELKQILSKFGTSLVSMEHNPILMRTFLLIGYTWAELYLTLTYYTSEANLLRTVDNDCTACNLTYLHSYLSKDHWCLLSQRITNFGQQPCKDLMQKLLLQKLKGFLLFEKNVEDVQISIVKQLSLTANDNWKSLLSDNFVVKNVVLKMESSEIISLVEMSFQEAFENQNMFNIRLLDNQVILNTLIYISLTKINRLFRGKRKLHQESSKNVITGAFGTIPQDLFFDLKTSHEKVINIVLEIFVSYVNENNSDLKIGGKLSEYLKVLSLIPIVFSSVGVQSYLFLYLFGVLIEINDVELKNTCERLLIGIAQNRQFSFATLFQNETFIQVIISRFDKYTKIFDLILDDFLKHEEQLVRFKPILAYLCKNLKQEKPLKCCISVLNLINKLKKTSKLSTVSKQILQDYHETVCNKLSKLLLKGCKPQLLEAFATVLKIFLSKDQKDGLQNLQPLLKDYIDLAISSEIETSNLILFTTVLQHKNQLTEIDNELVLQIWDTCKNLNDANPSKYSKLIPLIFESISEQDKFSEIINDLLKMTNDSLMNQQYDRFGHYMKIWNSVLPVSFNTLKGKIWQNSLEALMQFVVTHDHPEEVADVIFKFQINVIHTTNLALKPSVIDAFLIGITLAMSKDNFNFQSTFNFCVEIMDSLLNYRTALLMDRLSSYFQQYRTLLKHLCDKSNSDLKLEMHEVQPLADCAHKLERLTYNLMNHKRDLARISPYLIVYILEQYESHTLYLNVKVHLNNCLYTLISLLDQHALSFVMRILSTASTEIFKVSYENYKKYYKYTGKV